MVEESELKSFLKDYLENGEPENFVDLEKDGEVIHQYVHGTHNVTLLNGEVFEEVKELVRNKEFDVIQASPEERWLTFMGYEEAGKDAELIKEILSLRNISLEDIENMKVWEKNS